jgi:hypothetical protein
VNPLRSAPFVPSWLRAGRREPGRGGYGVSDPADGDGLTAGGVVDGDTLGAGEERDGVADGLAVRDGLGDRLWLGAGLVGVDVADGLTVGCVAPAGGATGRTR